MKIWSVLVSEQMPHNIAAKITTTTKNNLSPQVTNFLIRSWIVLRKNWIALLWSRSQERFKIPVIVHLDIMSSTAEPFVIKLVW